MRSFIRIANTTPCFPIRLPRALLPVLACVAMLCVGASSARAQLAGIYTIGGSAPDYATIEAAIADLNARGVSAPVTFAIRSGRYTPPPTGYVLGAVATMSAANTVTFRPEMNAAVTIEDSLPVPIFDINGGRHFIVDGWSGAGAQRHEMNIIQRGDSSAVRFINGAQFNTVRNCNLMANGPCRSFGVLNFSTSNAAGNSYNVVERNTIGDSTAALRSDAGIFMMGTIGAANTRNRIQDNDIVNMGHHGGFMYGLRYLWGNDSTLFVYNRIHTTNTLTTENVFPLYGVYCSGITSTADTIAYNRIWALKSRYGNAGAYGIYFGGGHASSIAVHDNMIALNGDSVGGLDGIHAELDSASRVMIAHNSIEISDATTTINVTNGIYANSPHISLLNNVISLTLRSRRSAAGYGIYRTNGRGTFTNDHNVVYLAGAGYLFGGYNGKVYATLDAWQLGTGLDSNSRIGDPRFIDPAAGDLHIRTNSTSAVEGAGTPIAGLNRDLDGDDRDGRAPDAGADEGPFGPLPSTDMAADVFLKPAAGARRPRLTLFSPTAQVVNAGTITLRNIRVRYRILNKFRAVVYSDTQTVARISAGSSAAVMFDSVGNMGGTTALPLGTYSIELATELPGDQNAANDLLTGMLMLDEPLNGLYTIDKHGSGPRNYRSFTAATVDLNEVGVSGPVTFEIADGTYDDSTETFPLVLNAAPGTSAANTVRFRPAAGAEPILTGASPASSALIIIDSGSRYTLDGSSTLDGTGRHWTIRNTEPTSNATIWLRNGADLNTIENCTVQGNSTRAGNYSGPYDLGIVLIGTRTVETGNDSNVVRTCTIGDPIGSYRGTLGLGCYGTKARPNRGNRFDHCDILNFGNAGTAGYGVVMYGEQAGTVVTGCEVHNTVPSTANILTLYGIYMDYSPGYPINCIIDGNRIHKLTGMCDTLTAYGISHWVSTDSANTRITNNVISLAETGAQTYFGVYFRSSTGATYLFHNTFYFGGVSTGSKLHAMVYAGSRNRIYGRNNLFHSNRTSIDSLVHAVYITADNNWSSDNNSFSADALGTLNAGYYKKVCRTLDDLRTATGQDRNSVTQTEMPFVLPSIDDFHIDTRVTFAGARKGAVGLGVSTDIDGDPRDPEAPTIGADEVMRSTLGTQATERPNDPSAAPLDALTVAPNPARGVVKIGVHLPSAEHVTIELFDATGRRVEELANDVPCGDGSFELDAGALPSGVYVLRLTTARGEVAARPLIVAH